MKHLFCILILTSVAVVGETITFTGPEDSSGTPCVPTAGHCIAGDPLIYDVFSASITTPSTPGGQWTLVIETNYGVSLPGPAGGPVIPDYPFETTGISFGIGDFLIEWNGGFYGIVLSAHDGYVPGDLYKASGFQTSADVMVPAGVPLVDLPRPSLDVLINAGAAPPVGTGTLAASKNAGSDGMSSALYTITDTFNAPANFLDSAFTVFDSSYVCANGYLTGSNPGGFTLGESGGTPEPSSWLLILPGLVLLGIGQLRKSRRAEN